MSAPFRMPRDIETSSATFGSGGQSSAYLQAQKLCTFKQE